MKSARFALLVALTTVSCALVRGRRGGGPESRPAGDEGMALFTVGRLSFEAPAGWQVRGDRRHVVLVNPETEARIDARVLDQTFGSDSQCLAKAEKALARGDRKFQNIRRHPTTLAGRRALIQEADQEGGWHGWAWAVCDAGEQYRISFTGHSPLDAEAMRASRLLASSAALSGRPGA